jgi:hypothetical protein
LSQKFFSFVRSSWETSTILVIRVHDIKDAYFFTYYNNRYIALILCPHTACNSPFERPFSSHQTMRF